MVAAIIGGTGMYDLLDGTPVQESIKTPYGTVNIERIDDLIFINRHAPNHSVPPHKVNYRAHIRALQQLGVKRVCATFAVGSVNEDFELGVPIILDDFIDFSSGRESTFYDEIKQGKGHVDMSVPFCPVLSDALENQANTHGIHIRRGGVYASSNGPRFETPAEIRTFRRFGTDVVGMTLCPEITLAREAGMSYAGLAYSINWGAGMTPAIELVSHNIDQIKADMMKLMIGALNTTQDDQCTPAPII